MSTGFLSPLVFTSDSAANLTSLTVFVGGTENHFWKNHRETLWDCWTTKHNIHIQEKCCNVCACVCARTCVWLSGWWPATFVAQRIIRQSWRVEGVGTGRRGEEREDWRLIDEMRNLLLQPDDPPPPHLVMNGALLYPLYLRKPSCRYIWHFD